MGNHLPESGSVRMSVRLVRVKKVFRLLYCHQLPLLGLKRISQDQQKYKADGLGFRHMEYRAKVKNLKDF